MIQDIFRLTHTSDHPDAVAAFERATEEVAGHRRDAGAALGEALAADPQLVAAHCLKGFAQLILAGQSFSLGRKRPYWRLNRPCRQEAVRRMKPF